jgi:hypothetical protein
MSDFTISSSIHFYSQKTIPGKTRVLLTKFPQDPGLTAVIKRKLEDNSFPQRGRTPSLFKRTNSPDNKKNTQVRILK